MVEKTLTFICPPETSVLDSIHNDNLTWKVALGELVDNAFDAGATRVEIIFGPGRGTVRVADDGAGIENITDLVTVGRHVKRETTRLGRYGIGFKSAACWMWGTANIETVHAGLQWSSHIAWEALRKSNAWAFSQTEPKPTSDPPRTVLAFESITRAFPPFQALVSDLSFIFTPALRSLGKQITVESQRKKISCVPYELPILEQQIEDGFSVNGKGIKLRAGIVKEGNRNERAGFIYHHGHRVIMHCSLGAREFSVARFAGLVQLDKSWSLAKNKNEISDSDKDALGDAIFQRCRPILEAAQKQTQSIELREFSDRVQSRIRGFLASVTGKERRPGHRGHKGTVTPKHSGVTRKVVSAFQRGDKSLVSRAAASLTIDWHENPSDPLMGQADITASPPRVNFNLSHPFIAKVKNEANEDAVFLAAIQMFMTSVWEKSQQDKFQFAKTYGDIGAACSAVLAGAVAESKRRTA